MPKNKILFLARLYTPHIGGVELHVKKLSEQLLKDNAEITVVTEQDSPQQLLQEIIDGVTVLRIPLPNQQTSKFAIWKWIITHYKIFFTFDVIHVHDVFFWIFPLYPFLKVANKNIFMTFHGHEGNGNPTSKQIFWHRVAEKLSTANICIGGFHQKWYGVTPTIVSYGAVEVLPHKKNSSKSEKITNIIYLGRVAEDNGILTYLEAIKQLSKKEKISLDVFGDGPLLDVAQKYAEDNSLPVKFHGFTNHESINWQEYDIAFVSRYLSLLECFSVGLPIIAHYDSEIKKDYLQQTPFSSWIVTANSITELVEGFSKVLSPSWKKNINEAQEWSQQQTWQKIARDYNRLWKNS